MSLLDDEVVEPTLEEKKIRAAKNLSQASKQLFTQMVITYNRCMEIVWNNPAGLTPQQVLDGVGTKGLELFTLAGNLRGLVNGAKPGTIPEPTLPPMTFAEDGTCTITVEPEPEPAP